MRKLVAALFISSLGIGAAQAAPDALKCPEKFDPLKPASMNCFSDEIFILNGADPVLLPGAPAPRALVDCSDKAMGGKDSKNCFVGDLAKSLSIEGLQLAVDRAVELMRAKSPTLPTWDEVVVFTSDFGPSSQPG